MVAFLYPPECVEDNPAYAPRTYDTYQLDGESSQI